MSRGAKMPHASSGDDLAPSDEIKVFTLEGEGDEEKRSSAENLNDLKSSLVTEGEGKNAPSQVFAPTKSSESSSPDQLAPQAVPEKPLEYFPPPLPFGCVMPPYHPNSAIGAMSVVKKVPIVAPNHAGSPLSLMMYNSESFEPPPAHMGIPPVHIDPKTGMPRHPMYPLTSPSQYHSPVFGPDFSHQFQWHPGSMYSIPSGFRCSPYAGSAPIHHNNLPKFASLIHPHPRMLSSHPNISHLVEVGLKLEVSENNENKQSNEHQRTSADRDDQPQNQAEKKKIHIKKPLNAFMLYMKEMRAKVIAECTQKESAAINQILGKKWRNLSGEEQAPYYAMAEKERDLHKQRYPGWSARDNYAQNSKKKKKREKMQDGDGSNPKKCRARFGLDQQDRWCKPCRRKKKCIRYLNGSDNAEENDNFGSLGSSGSVEAPSPDSRADTNYAHSDNETEESDSDNHVSMSSELSMSSPPVPNFLDIHPSSNPKMSIGSPSCDQHSVNKQHLSQVSSKDSDSPDSGVISIPELPTPPSTDSSTGAAPLLTVI